MHTNPERQNTDRDLSRSRPAQVGEAFTQEILFACFNDLNYLRFILNRSPLTPLALSWTDQRGNGVLHIISLHDNYDAARLLLEARASPCNRNCLLETPIHWAAKRSSIRVLGALLDPTFRDISSDLINFRDMTGSTALHCAARDGIPEPIPILLSHGIDVSLKDCDGLTAIALAECGNKSEHQAVLTILYRFVDRFRPDLRIDIDVRIPEEAGKDREEIGQKTRGKSRKEISSINTCFDDTVEEFAEIWLLSNDERNIFSESHLEQEPQIDIVRPTAAASATVANKPTNSDGNTPHETFLPSLARSSSLPSLSSRPARSTVYMQSLLRVRGQQDSDSPSKVQKSLSVSKSMTKRPLAGNPVGFWTSAPRRSAFDINGAEMINQDSPPERSFDSQALKCNVFTPQEGEKYDLIIEILQCADCDKHSVSLWHDERRYSSCADHILSQLVSFIEQKSKIYPFRVFGLKNKVLDRARLGALEVWLSIRCRSQQDITDRKANQAKGSGRGSSSPSAAILEDQDRVDDFNEYAVFSDQNGWITTVLHSKLQSKRWPNIEGLLIETEKFIENTIKTNLADSAPQLKADGTGEGGGISGHFSKAVAQESSLISWQKRMWGNNFSQSGPGTRSRQDQKKGRENSKLSPWHTTEFEAIRQSTFFATSLNVRNEGPDFISNLHPNSKQRKYICEGSADSGGGGGSPFIDPSALGDAHYRQLAMSHFLAFDARNLQ